MSRHPDYNNAAYLAAICDEIERKVVDEYVDETSSARKVLICENVLFSDREVPPGAWHDFLGMVRELGKKARSRMDDFELRPKNDPGYRLGEDHGNERQAGKPNGKPAAHRAAAGGGPGLRARGPRSPSRG